MSESIRFATLESFVGALHEEGLGREDYEGLLRRVDFDFDAVRRYCHFRDELYTRNLIARSEHFELLALCWSPGQVSPIHDHAGSDGWIRAMAGACEEVWYHCELDPNGGASWTRGRTAQVPAGAMSYINDDLAWHTVGNRNDEPAVTLHLYSPPIDSCQYIDGNTGLVRTKEMSYYSRDGALVE